MPDNLALLLVGSLVAMRLFSLVSRGARRELAPYLVLLVADLAMLAIADTLGPRGAAVAFVGICAGVMLVFAPGVLDSLETRAQRHGDARGRKRALWIARAREVFVPGRGAAQRRRALEHLGAASDGDTERLLDQLTQEVAGTTDPEAAQRAHAELVQLQIAAGRSADALEHAQRQLGPETYERSAALTAAVATALSERGRPREAARLLALLETQAANQDVTAQALLLPARLFFIAGSGQAEDLEKVLAVPVLARSISPATAARLRATASSAVAQEVAAQDPEVGAVARELAARLLETGSRASISIFRRAPLTIAIVSINVAIALLLLTFSGDEELMLARAGALFRPAVVAGEWWRLVTAMFLHAGPFHLAANMYGLYLLGRTTEELLGWPRLFIIYALAGLGGGLASLWADRGLSVGASGAIMGVLAALTVVIFARRHSFSPAAVRMLLGNLLFLALLQGFLGWQIPQIDSAAHAGGFLAGLLATAGLVPSREMKPGPWLLRATAIFIAIAFVGAAALVVRRPLADTLARLPMSTVEVDGLVMEVPRSWQKDASGLLVDPHLGIELRVARDESGIHFKSPQADDPRIRPLLARISASARPASQPP